MKRRSLIGVGLVVALTSGCVSPYMPPTAAQPHALLKLRRIYQSSAGATLRESVTVDGHVAFAASESRTVALSPRSDVVLVHPVAASVRVAADFSHEEMRVATEQYSVQVPYEETEVYNCGTGADYQTCTRSVTRYRTEWRTRTVNRSVDVSDGSCAGSVWISPKAGGEYLLNYDYSENAVCHLACFEQVREAEPGAFQTRACPEPTPAEMQQLLGRH